MLLHSPFSCDLLVWMQRDSERRCVSVLNMTLPHSIRLLPASTAVALLLSPASAFSQVVSIEITSRAPVENGRVFGNAGPYEIIRGRVHGEVDPSDRRNRIIQDAAQSYAELAKWEQRLAKLQEAEGDAKKMQSEVSERVKEGVDTVLREKRGLDIDGVAAVPVGQRVDVGEE